MENNEVSKSNKIKIIVITALIFLVSIAGISYAYFTIQITGNDTASSMRLRTANMSLVYNDVQIVSGEYATPGWTDTKTLTVTNNGNVDAYYTIIWRDLYNEVINGELVISATCSSTSGTCPAISETVVPTTTPEGHNINVKQNIEIPVGVTHTYTLTALFKEIGSNQNYNQNKEFYGTLNIAEGSAPATATLLTDQGTSGLSTGDTVRLSKTGMENQDFYVVSTNANETVLLAKYNLYAGRICVLSASNLCTQISTSAAGYGLQSSEAKGWDGTNNSVGAVPFCGSSGANGYWYDSTNSTIKSQYGASYNASNIYDTAYTTAPNWSVAFKNNAGNEYYSIAYYVEEYVNTLGINGIGRLLTYAEEQTLESSNNSVVNNGTSYWLGSASDNYQVVVVSNNDIDIENFDAEKYNGVRPVIVVSTSDIVS